MTIDIYVLCERSGSTIEEWQGAIDDLGFDLELRSTRDLAERRGLLPALWRGREAGFECTTIPFADLIATYDDIDLGGPWACVYALYVQTLTGCVGAWIGAAAMVRQAGGRVFDPQEGKLLSADDAARWAARTQDDLVEIERK